MMVSVGGSLLPMLKLERWVDVSHQRLVGDDAEDQTVHPEHELVEGLRVAAGKEQHDAAKKMSRPTRPPSSTSNRCRGRRRRPVAAGKDRDDEVVRQGEKPPLDEHEPA